MLVATVVPCTKKSMSDASGISCWMPLITPSAGLAGVVATFNVYEDGVLTASVPLNGLGGTGSLTVDLSAYQRVTRLEIVGIDPDPAENGIAWDDFSFVPNIVQVTNQYPLATFSSSSGNVNNAVFDGVGNVLLSGPAGGSPTGIEDTYVEGWRLGLKAIAIYRDGCKRTQPLSTASGEKREEVSVMSVAPQLRRRKLSDTRSSLTHKFSVAGHEGYITVGLYPDGRPGELFITMAKEGSTVGGLMDCFGTAISMSLQYGVPLEVLVNKFSHTRFDPMGNTTNPEVRMAKSLVDYIFRWLKLKFGEVEATPAQIGAFLMALRLRGETVDEIVGATRTMRDKMLKVRVPSRSISPIRLTRASAASSG